MIKRIFLIMIFFTAAAGQKDPEQFKREEMVRTQLIPRGIRDARVLEAFRRVPRHLFVPPEYRRYACYDQPLPIGEGQTISQPYIVAYMTEVLQLSKGDKVLEIGTGSGYQAAILAELNADVYTVEIFPSLSGQAESVLKSLGYNDIHIKTGDGYQGWAEYAPFDAILVTCSPSAIPEPLKEQLAEKGRMIIPVGERDQVQFLFLLEKKNGHIRQKNVLPVRFVPMIDQKGKSY